MLLYLDILYGIYIALQSYTVYMCLYNTVYALSIYMHFYCIPHNWFLTFQI
jgi:hypothetical protein